MELIAETATLNIFESPEFEVGGDWSGTRRLYVGFVRGDRRGDALGGDYIQPAVTALVAFYYLDKGHAGDAQVLNHLQTTNTDDINDDARQAMRDEFMEALRTHLPAMDDPDPETVMSYRDGGVHYVDTRDSYRLLREE